MTTRHFISYAMLLLLSACASKEMRENLEETRDTVDAVLEEAAAVKIPEAEAPPEEVLDELVSGSGISVPGLEQDLRLETAFDISVSKAPARLFFMSLVKDTNINMVVHPDVAGEISLDLKNVTVREVMKLSREVYGYEYQESEMGYIVLPARIQSRIFAVNYLNVTRMGESTMTVSSGAIGDSDVGGDDGDSGDDSSSAEGSSALKSSKVNTTSQTDFWTDLQATLTSIIGGGKGRSIVVDRHAGLVVVRAMPGELRDVEAYLDNAQASLQRQVILEAKVIEVDLNDSFQSGIDWAAVTESRDLAFGTSSIVGGVGGRASIDGNGDVVVAPGLDLTNVAFANLFAVGSSAETFGSLITLLENQGNVHILSSPRVSTVNNQKAVIKVGSDEFFVTEVSSDTTSSAGGIVSNPELTLTPFFSGIALDVTPQISAEGEIILHIHPSISEVDDQIKVITLGGQAFELPLALSTVRESDSIVKAKNGQVVVIGGLMKNVASDNLGSVPGVSDVPLLGEAFKQKQIVNRRSELVILLRPVVIDSNEIWSKSISESAERVKTLRPTRLQENEAE